MPTMTTPTPPDHMVDSAIREATILRHGVYIFETAGIWETTVNCQIIPDSAPCMFVTKCGRVIVY